VLASLTAYTVIASYWTTFLLIGKVPPPPMTSTSG
jgi:hypothetical protein